MEHPPSAVLASPRALGPRLAAYIALTKPRIIELLLITTLPAMILAAGGWPGAGLVMATIGGGALSAGGANVINNVADRDIDARMRRTSARPLPAERVAPAEARTLGVALGIAGFLVLWGGATIQAALLATAALLFYVFVYTLGLKRTTPHNIVIGGAAGAAPTLVGWAAVTGTLALPAWILFGVVFFWTPPHFWALSIRFRDDYERAGVPMLPVVAGERETVRQIVWYSILLAGLSVLLAPAAGIGVVYVTGAAVLGAGLVGMSLTLLRSVRGAMRVFMISNLYLALLFALVAADVLSEAGPLSSSVASGVAWAGAAVVIAAAGVILTTMRPRPQRSSEVVWLAAPAAMAAALVAAVMAAL